MNIIKLHVLILLFVTGFFTLELKAQEQGEVNFLVDVDNGYFEIVVNDTMYLKIYKCTLPVGHHRAKVWSPGYSVKEVEFDVKAGEVTKQYVEMEVTSNRKQFESEYKDYRMKFHKSLTVPGSATLAVGVTSAFLMMKAYDTKQQVYSNIKDYFNAPTYYEAVTYRQNIEDLNRKYNALRFSFYTGLGLTLAGTVTTIITYKKFKKNYTEPTFNPESPFKDRFSLNVGPTAFSLSFKI
ncbi:hypothetical protein K6119_01960 [Paracrocinitomix mangrovi]|uniref:hypothetical protein n=1 Tax=Paracrocinitomix mangrovi TaxID=2862509 RepID=UPI001C8ED957|nr:hypothetical protein [Paracrocinitomix mangrovi]UKN02283.1 hypothetical protein K6119_01960 [Paracrocinitomix mangrovi]